VFNLQVPTACPGVPTELLLPSSSWADGEAYERELRQLAQRFVANFERFLVSRGLCWLGSSRQLLHWKAACCACAPCFTWSGMTHPITLAFPQTALIFRMVAAT